MLVLNVKVEVIISQQCCCSLILGVSTNTTQTLTDLGLCAANRSDFRGKSDSNEEATGGSSLYYALFILGMVVAGAGCTPMIALGVPYIDENVNAKVSPMYVGIFVACGMLGESSCHGNG